MQLGWLKDFPYIPCFKAQIKKQDMNANEGITK